LAGKKPSPVAKKSAGVAKKTAAGAVKSKKPKTAKDKEEELSSVSESETVNSDSDASLDSTEASSGSESDSDRGGARKQKGKYAVERLEGNAPSHARKFAAASYKEQYLLSKNTADALDQARKDVLSGKTPRAVDALRRGE
jgi:hypothetical protein